MKKENICMALGILSWSIGSHCTAYGVLRGIAEGGAVLVSGITAVCLYLAGAVLMGTAVFMAMPKKNIRDSARKLLLLGGGYVLLQLLLSVLAGVFAWTLGRVSSLESSQIKTVTDIVCRIVQVPVRAVILVILLYIITGIEREHRIITLKAAAACAVYLLVQWSMERLGTGLPPLVVRTLLSAAVTTALWQYICMEYKKGGGADETVEK